LEERCLLTGFNEFTLPTGNASLQDITAGPDGNLWFTEYFGNKIGRITPAGQIHEFPIPGTDGRTPHGITAGPDGNLWFTEYTGNQIGRITAAGLIHEFPIPTSFSYPSSITAGPDGNLWFTEFYGNKIGRITPAGAVSEFVVPTLYSGPYGITAGPDGNLWFTEFDDNKIGRVTPAGAVSEFIVPTSGSGPNWITAGADGNLWFTERSANKIGRMTPAGAVREFVVPTSGSGPQDITAGPDGNLWFTESSGNKIGRITPAGLIHEFLVPTGSSYPISIAAGPDGSIWFTESSANEIGRLILPTYLDVRALTNPIPAGAAFVFTVTARDPFNTAASLYRGTVHFTSSDPAAVLPFDYTFTAADDGTHTFLATLFTAGGQTIRVTDTAWDALAGMAVTTSEFPIPGTGARGPYGITAGPDGNLWFTESPGNKIGRITTDGQIDEFPIPGTGASSPWGVTAGPDGNLWFTESGGQKIGRITPDGQIDQFPVLTASSYPQGITAGPDRNLWFTEYDGNKIGRITPAGTLLPEFSIPTTDARPVGIAAGPDGNLWFTELFGNKIGRVTPAGSFSEIRIPTAGGQPYAITAGPDGNLWFTEGAVNKVGRITPGGIVTEFSFPTTPGQNARAIAAGPDGNLWFTENYAALNSAKIGRITPDGTITEFLIPTSTGSIGITAGPDGKLWFSEYFGNKIGRLVPGVVVTPAADHFLVLAPAVVVPGVPFDVTVVAVDPYGNVDTNYRGTVTFTTSDPAAGVVLPAAYTFAAADQGTHTFTDTGLGETTLLTAGDQALMVSDIDSGINGSTTVTVAAAGAPTVGGPRATPALAAGAVPMDMASRAGAPAPQGSVIDALFAGSPRPRDEWNVYPPVRGDAASPVDPAWLTGPVQPASTGAYRPGGGLGASRRLRETLADPFAPDAALPAPVADDLETVGVPRENGGEWGHS
jgi:streptogramin lyase